MSKTVSFHQGVIITFAKIRHQLCPMTSHGVEPPVKPYPGIVQGIIPITQFCTEAVPGTAIVGTGYPTTTVSIICLKDQESNPDQHVEQWRDKERIIALYITEPAMLQWSSLDSCKESRA